VTSFICPGCGRSAFYAHAPIFDYAPRRWRVWLPPRKRWIGDLVRCANPRCHGVAVAGLNGVLRLEGVPPPPAAPPPEPGEQNGEAPKPREVSQIHDSDMRWFRDAR